jgi:putative oxidoreductase
MIQALSRWGASLEKGWSLPLLIMRLVLAYGFYHAAAMKWADINAIVGWFQQSKFPVPVVSAYLVAFFEAAGALLLLLGLFTRLITIPLMIIMLVAIFAVHWPNGFEAGKNGFEIPLYYLIMLFALFVMGPGIISVDHSLGKKNRK